MKVITIEDKIWLNEIAKIHEHLISENESNYQVTTTSISLRYEMLKARLKYSQDAILSVNKILLSRGLYGHTMNRK